MERIGIVILTHGDGDLTNQCINSISSKDSRNFELIYYLIDSTPVPQKEKILYELTDKINFEYHYVVNNGYSAGNNVGLIRAKENKCDYVLVANNDVVFLDNTITDLINGFKVNNDIGIVGPKIFLQDGSIQEINMLVETTICGTYKYLLRKTPLRFLSRKYINSFQYNLKQGEPICSFFAHSVSGCCFMISNKCIDAITIFDEETFLYHEEIILGKKLEELGFKTLYSTEAQIIHIGGMSTGKMSSKTFQYFVDSELYYFLKYQQTSRIILLPLILIRFFSYLNIIKKDTKRGKKLYEFFRMLIDRMGKYV